MILFRNKKNQKIYKALGVITNATNSNDGQKMVLYIAEDSNVYARSLDEFKIKFTYVDEFSKENDFKDIPEIKSISTDEKLIDGILKFKIK